ncbi:uncharacterized protein LOC143265949 [Megachile rotundata]|uniref:uncharacterized protein LOC143265949 n=1 Tax=Megachile rotundata TaxID=143995 RepID=UPI003FCF5383
MAKQKCLGRHLAERSRNSDSEVEEWKAGLLKEVRESTDVSGLQLFFHHNKRHKGLATWMHPERCTIDPESGENVVLPVIRYEWYLRYGVRGTPGVMEKGGGRIYVPPISIVPYKFMSDRGSSHCDEFTSLLLFFGFVRLWERLGRRMFGQFEFAALICSVMADRLCDGIMNIHYIVRFII